MKFPSLPLVWPSNWGSMSRTLTMAVRPSRMSSPWRLSSLSLRSPRDLPYLLSALVGAFLKPSSCIPSMVLMPLAKSGCRRCCARCSTGRRSRSPGRPRTDRSSRPGGRWRRLLRLVDVLDEVDDAALVLEGDRLGVLRTRGGRSSGSPGPGTPSSGSARGVCVRKWTSSMMVGSGRSGWWCPSGHAGPCRRPATRWIARPPAKSISQCLPSRSISTSSRSDNVDHRHHDAVQSARDLVAVATELAAGIELVITTSTADIVRCLECLSTRMPRPSSSPRTLRRRADGRRCRCNGPPWLRPGVVHNLVHQVVEPGRTSGADVHPGRLRTAWRPSRTWMSLAP